MSLRGGMEWRVRRGKCMTRSEASNVYRRRRRSLVDRSMWIIARLELMRKHRGEASIMGLDAARPAHAEARP